MSDDLEPGQLRPCPFCGEAAQRYDAEGGGSAIECSRCQASTALHFDRKENLDSSWNDRAPAPASQTRQDIVEDIVSRVTLRDGETETVQDELIRLYKENSRLQTQIENLYANHDRALAQTRQEIVEECAMICDDEADEAEAALHFPGKRESIPRRLAKKIRALASPAPVGTGDSK